MSKIRISKKKIERMIGLLLVSTITLASVGIENIVNAKDKQEEIIATSVHYNDERTGANIIFDMDTANQQKYEITSVVSDKEATVVYDEKTISEEQGINPVTYGVKENGTYSFTVKYIEKQENISSNTENVPSNTDEESIDKNNSEDEVKREIGVTEDEIKSEVLTEKLTVVVDGIRELEESKVISDSPESNENSPSGTDTGASYTNGSYTVSSIKFNSEKDTTPVDVTQEIINGISGNKLPLSTAQMDKNYQITTFTSSQTVDFGKGFTLTGTVNLGDLAFSSGVAIAFHSDGADYRHEFTRFAHTQRFGIYPGSDPYSALDAKDIDGIKYRPALAVEIDSWDSDKYSHIDNHYLKNDQGVDGPRGRGGKGSHAGIQPFGLGRKGDGDHDISGSCIGDMYRGNYWFANYNAHRDSNDWIKGDVNFQITWTGLDGTGNGIFKFEVLGGGRDGTHQRQMNAKEYFGVDRYRHMNLTIGSGNGRNDGISGQGTKDSYLIINDIQYDEPIKEIGDPQVSIYENGVANNVPNQYDNNANVSLRDIKYAMGVGMTAEVSFTLKNKKNTLNSFPEIVYLNDLQIAGQQAEVVPGTVRVQDSGKANGIVAYPNVIFDKNNPLSVDENGNVIIYYPINSEELKVYFEIKLPDNFKWDINDSPDKKLPFLTMDLSVGESGTPQTNFHKEMSIRSQPNIRGNQDYFDRVGNANQKYSYQELVDNQLQAKVYDDENWHPLSQANTNSLTESGKFYYFDAGANKVEISKEEFNNRSKRTPNGTGVYAYDFKMEDSREVANDKRLSGSQTVRVFQSVDAQNVNQAVTGDGYILLANGSKLTLKDTHIIKAFQWAPQFEQQLTNSLSLKAYKDDGGLQLSQAKLVFEYDKTLLKNPRPGVHEIKVKVEGTSLEKIIQLTILENPWSYDTPDRTTAKGASGFIVIPKSIELEKSSDGASITSLETIRYAEYEGSQVKYDLAVDKTFQLTKTDDPSSKVEVVSSSDHATTDIGTNKIYIGQLALRQNQNVIFTAPSAEVDKVKGRWTGSVTFYLERK